MLTVINLMVNENSVSRSTLLNHLRKNSDPLSGTDLGGILGISRVAVRKHILRLAKEGFVIESGRKGYRLLSEPEFPSPSEYDSGTIHIQNEVESTMEEASRNSLRNCEDIQFYLARRQKAGRGRNRKSWVSPDGGLYLTAAFRPRLPAAYISLYIIETGLALVDSLREHYGVDCRFRWPNDLFVDEKKLGGLLLEVSGPAESPDHAFLGLGLNVLSSVHFSETGDRRVTCLQNEIPGGGRDLPDLKTLFETLKPVIESSLGMIEADKVRKHWRARTSTQGKVMRIDDTDYTVRNLALNGSLIVADKDGTLYEIAPGPRMMGPR